MSNFMLRQLFDRETCTYTYVLVSDGKAVVIDPVLELVERDTMVIKQLGVELLYILNTHVHADHVTGSGLLKKNFPSAKSVISKVSGALADVKVEDGTKVKFGSHELSVVPTPGHTAGCVSYYLEGDAAASRPPFVFTGDALLVRGCGRTDFQGGSSEDLFKSVNTRLFTLPPETVVYPAHDYKGFTSSTIGEEVQFNPRLKKGQTVDGFKEIMTNLKLSYPKRIDVSLPLNMMCGLHELVKDDEKEEDSKAADGGGEKAAATGDAK